MIKYKLQNKTGKQGNKAVLLVFVPILFSYYCHCLMVLRVCVATVEQIMFILILWFFFFVRLRIYLSNVARAVLQKPLSIIKWLSEHWYYWFLTDPGKARGCLTNPPCYSMTLPLVVISLRRRHAQMGNNGSLSHITNYIDIFQRF